MFGKRPKVIIPEKQTHTHHHYAPSPWPDHVFPAMWRVIALVGVFAAVSWLSRENHHDRPVQHGLYAVGLIVLIYVLWPRLEALLDRYYQYRLEVQELRLKYQHTRQHYRPVLTNPAQSRLLRLCEAALGEAYLHLHQHGRYKKGQGRPWSKRNAGAIVLRDDGDRPVGEHLGAQVRGVLVRHQIIKGPPGFDQLNLRKFPNLQLALEELKRP